MNHSAIFNQTHWIFLKIFIHFWLFRFFLDNNQLSLSLLKKRFRWFILSELILFIFTTKNLKCWLLLLWKSYFYASTLWRRNKMQEAQISRDDMIVEVDRKSWGFGHFQRIPEIGWPRRSCINWIESDWNVKWFVEKFKSLNVLFLLLFKQNIKVKSGPNLKSINES